MKKILIGVVALAVMVSPSIASAASNDVSLTTDTVLTVGGIDLNIAGSTAALESIEMADSGNSFTVVLSNGSSIKITSADRRVLTNSAPGKYVITDSCTSSVSTLELASYSGTVTVVITPTSTICTVTATPSTSGTSITSTVKKPVVMIPVTTTANNTANQTIASSITRSLQRGMTGDDIRTLQTLLSTDPSVYPEKSVTGYFGPATERAVKAFQAKYKLPTVGAVGPMTRAMLIEIFGTEAPAVPAVPATPATPGVAPATPAIPASPSTGSISRPLKIGSTGSDVKTLQQFLNASGFTIAGSGVGSPGNETDYLGRLTVEAIKKFQAKYGIVSSGTPETTGYGRVGPKTRAKLNELMGQ